MEQLTLIFENASVKNRLLKVLELMNGVTVVTSGDRQKAVKAIRRLTRQKETQDVEKEYISKEELLVGIREGLEDVKKGRTRPAIELLKELRHEL